MTYLITIYEQFKSHAPGLCSCRLLRGCFCSFARRCSNSRATRQVILMASRHKFAGLWFIFFLYTGVKAVVNGVAPLRHHVSSPWSRRYHPLSTTRTGGVRWAYSTWTGCSVADCQLVCWSTRMFARTAATLFTAIIFLVALLFSVFRVAICATDSQQCFFQFLSMSFMNERWANSTWLDSFCRFARLHSVHTHTLTVIGELFWRTLKQVLLHSKISFTHRSPHHRHGVLRHLIPLLALRYYVEIQYPTAMS